MSNKTHKEYWGEMLTTLRKETGLSQRSAAIAAKMNRSTLRAFESGASSITISDLENLLTLYGYELDAVKVDL